MFKWSPVILFLFLPPLNVVYFLRALMLLDQYRQKSRLFRSPVLLVPLGDDFRYTEAREWDAQFTNYQKLFDYFNQHPELHIKVRHLRGGGACGEETSAR